MFGEYPKSITLRNEQKILIRIMDRDDESRLLDFFRELSPGDRLYLKEDVTDPRVIRRWVENLDFDHVIPILAVADDRIVGDATLHRNPIGWSKHVAELRLVTHPEYRCLGLGEQLAREIFFLALKLRLDKVIAQMMEIQESAVQVFERLGFHREALLKDHVMDTNGDKHNLIIMSQDINNFWRRIQDLFEEELKVRSGS